MQVTLENARQAWGDVSLCPVTDDAVEFAVSISGALRRERCYRKKFNAHDLLLWLPHLPADYAGLPGAGLKLYRGLVLFKDGGL